jgi:hypothetical protein
MRSTSYRLTQLSPFHSSRRGGVRVLLLLLPFLEPLKFKIRFDTPWRSSLDGMQKGYDNFLLDLALMTTP